MLPQMMHSGQRRAKRASTWLFPLYPAEYRNSHLRLHALDCLGRGPRYSPR